MPNETEKTLVEARGPDISVNIYGGVLDYDGAGHYPGIELLNLVYCGSGDTLLPTSETVFLKRRAFDFPRKLVWDDSFVTHPARREVLLDDDTEFALKHLLECLQLEIPSATKRPGWERAHFFPYTRSLIHFDARRSRGTKETDHKVGIERRYLRGGGALAYKILRMDPDSERRQECIRGFENLFKGTKNSPLDRLAETMGSCSKGDEEASKDTIEERCRVFNDELDDLYRDGAVRILGHVDLSSVTRVKALVNWTGIWLVIMQMER